MNLTEIVNKAIPITFEGVKCAALESKLKHKALARREQLKKEILTLLQTQKNDPIQRGVERAEAY